jgi:hypothetical protein
VSTATVCIPGTRSYRAGVTRGYERAERMFSMEGCARIPHRSDVLKGRPFWVEGHDDIEKYLDGYALGFARRVSGHWPNGMLRTFNE